MKIIDGHNVNIFTDNIETGAIEQINQLLSIDVFCNCKIRIMPDVHAGAGCVNRLYGRPWRQGNPKHRGR